MGKKQNIEKKNQSTPKNDLTHPPDNASNKRYAVNISHSSFQGPLPHPDILAGYDGILPGAAERIITMAESEARHRRNLEESGTNHQHKLEEKQLSALIWETRLGQVFGLVIGMFTIGVGAYCALKGAQIAGSFIGTSGVVGLVYVFVTGRKQK